MSTAIDLILRHKGFAPEGLYAVLGGGGRFTGLSTVTGQELAVSADRIIGFNPVGFLAAVAGGRWIGYVA